MHLSSGFARPTSIARVVACVVSAPARAGDLNDVREFRVGMPVAQLPATGYADFACVAAPGTKLSGWSEYKTCQADQAGRHEVGFRYDDADNPMARINADYVGTKIGGHPVLISLLIGDDARLDAIRIDTDPHARFYLRKKAFLLADQVKTRYGEAGWVCKEGAPTAEQQPIGGVFIKEHCEKTTAIRHIVLDHELYRNPDAGPRNFVGGTQLLIERAG